MSRTTPFSKNAKIIACTIVDLIPFMIVPTRKYSVNCGCCLSTIEVDGTPQECPNCGAINIGVVPGEVVDLFVMNNSTVIIEANLN